MQLYIAEEKQIWFSMNAKPPEQIFTWQRFMGAQLPYGNDEGMQSFALALSVELSQNNGMVRGLSNCRSGSQKKNKQHTYY